MGKEPRIRPMANDAKAGTSARDRDRISTCILGLDERMGGGIPKGFISLIAGPAGSMKSSLCFSIARRAAMEGGKALYLTLEQDGASLLAQMSSLGLRTDGQSRLRVVDFSAVREDLSKAAEGGGLQETLGGLIERYRKEMGCDVLVVDSLDALFSIMELERPRQELFHLFRRLRGIGATVLLISEMLPDDRRFGKHGVEEFLADGIIHLRTREHETASLTSVRRYVGVVKMRQTAHDTDYHPFLFTKDGFELVLE
jgi:circadian clock protein KaiC